MSRIAIIQTAFPGDVVLCTPVFESLKSAGHYVAAVVRPQAEPLVRHNPYIDELICYDKRGGVSSFLKAVSALKNAECDTALIVQRYLKSALLPLYAGISKRIGYDISQARFLYSDEIHYDNGKHEVERCLALCKSLSPTAGFSPKIFISNNEINEANEHLFLNHVNFDNFVVITPGSIWQTKCWVGYTELTKLLKEKLACDIVLLGSADDYSLCEEISNAGCAVNLARKTNLLQSAAIIKMARLAIANDSAPAHIASAVGTPVVAIFGPTVPRFGFTPYSEKSAVIENRELYCRPCSLHGPKKCPEKHFRCMKEITCEQVLKAVEELIKR